MTDKNINFAIVAEDRFSRTFTTLRRDVASVGSGIASAASRAAGGLATLGLGSVASLGGAVIALRNISNEIDQIGKVSQALGSTVENISAIEDVARRTGDSLDTVFNLVNKFNKALKDARPGNPLDQAITALGLSAERLRGQDPAEAVRQVAVALSGFADDGNKARLTQELFGKGLREISPLLGNLAAQGRLNATVTTAQANAAAQFSDQLSILQTEMGNVARAATFGLLPVFNEIFTRMRVGTEIFGGVTETIKANAFKKTFTDAGEGVAFYSDRLDRLRRSVTNLEQNGNSFFDRLNAKNLREQVAELEKFEKFYRRVFALTAADNGQSNPQELARRGRFAGRLALPDLSSLDADRKVAGGGAKVSEAERYLEQLQRQGEKLQELSTFEQLLSDIQNKRIDGLTPKITAKLKTEARYVDLLRDQTKALTDQQAALDDLIGVATRRSDELDRILGATPTGQAREIERQLDVVLRFARANPEDDGIQRIALEAASELNARFKALTTVPVEVAAEVEKLQVTIDNFAKNSVDALVELGATGKVSLGGLFDSFKRDVLRELIEDPVRESMMNVVKTITSELGKLSGSGSPFSFLFDLFKGGRGGGGLGGGIGGFLGGLFGASSAPDGYASRAFGGGVNAGQIVRWQEGAREFFVPEERGTVMTQRDLRQMGGGNLSPTYHINITGGDPRATAQQLRAMLDERDVRMQRSMRHGRLRQS